MDAKLFHARRTSKYAIIVQDPQRRAEFGEYKLLGVDSEPIENTAQCCKVELVFWKFS